MPTKGKKEKSPKNQIPTLTVASTTAATTTESSRSRSRSRSRSGSGSSGGGGGGGAASSALPPMSRGSSPSAANLLGPPAVSKQRSNSDFRDSEGKCVAALSTDNKVQMASGGKSFSDDAVASAPVSPVVPLNKKSESSGGVREAQYAGGKKKKLSRTSFSGVIKSTGHRLSHLTGSHKHLHHSKEVTPSLFGEGVKVALMGTGGGGASSRMSLDSAALAAKRVQQQPTESFLEEVRTVAVAVNGHALTAEFFAAPSFCVGCGTFIWGLTAKQQRGLKCRHCHVRIHSKCCHFLEASPCILKPDEPESTAAAAGTAATSDAPRPQFNAFSASGLLVRADIAAAVGSASVNFNNRYLGELGAETLAAALSKDTNAQHIHLDKTSIGDEGCQLMCQALVFHPSVTKVSMAGCGIRDNGARRIATLILANKNIQKIDLSNNKIGVRGAQALIDALLTRPHTVTAVSIGGNPIFNLDKYEREINSLCADAKLDASDYSPTTVVAKVVSTEGTVAALDPRFHVQFNDLCWGAELGRGAFGVVVRGSYTGNECCIKVLQDRSSCARDELKHEAWIFSQLRPHASVTQFYGACLDPEYPFCLVQELVHGGNLQSLLRDRPDVTLSAADVISLAKDLTSGMTMIHRSDITHNDLACRNLLVVEGKGTTLKLRITDFGCAKSLQGQKSVSAEGSKVAWRWTDPWVLDSRHFAKHTDVYASMVCVWEILSRARPFDQLSNPEVVQTLKSGETLPLPVPLGPRVEVSSGLLGELSSLMKSCWIPDVDERPTFDTLNRKLTDLESRFIEKADVLSASAPVILVKSSEPADLEYSSDDGMTPMAKKYSTMGDATVVNEEYDPDEMGGANSKGHVHQDEYDSDEMGGTKSRAQDLNAEYDSDEMGGSRTAQKKDDRDSDQDDPFLQSSPLPVMVIPGEDEYDAF